MILRKLRLWLLSKGKITTYFGYAIGEIFLVVIGILIALKVNTWNQNQQLQKNEITILKELQVELQSNLELSNSRLVGAEKVKKNIQLILNYFDYKTEMEKDSLYLLLELMRRKNTFTVQTAAFESIKSKGFELISNDDLRLAVISLYDLNYAAYEKYYDTNEDDLNRSLHAEYETCCPSKKGVIVPDNIEEFRKNRIFYNKLSLMYDVKDRYRQIMLQSIDKTNELINKIEVEIETLENA